MQRPKIGRNHKESCMNVKPMGIWCSSVRVMIALVYGGNHTPHFLAQAFWAYDPWEEELDTYHDESDQVG